MRSVMQVRWKERGLVMETEYGVPQILHYVGNIEIEAAPWLRVREKYIERLRSREIDLWSPVEFVIPYLLGPAGDDPSVFGRLALGASDLILHLHEHKIPRTRTEQYGIRSAAVALGNAGALEDAFAWATRLSVSGCDPGWLLQLVVPALWETAVAAAPFSRYLDAIRETVIQFAELGIDSGYPFATGLAALVRHGKVLPRYLDEWLATILSMTRSLVQSDISPYPVFEYGLPGLGPEVGFPADRVIEALQIARQLADRGVYPGYVLQESLAMPHVDSDVSIDELLPVARRLAESAIDPRYVLRKEFFLQRTLLPDDDDGPGYLRLVKLAEDLHRNDHSLDTTFEEGLPWLLAMERDRPGFFVRGFALTEKIARSGMNPSHLLTWGLPRVLNALGGQRLVEEECLGWAEQLVDRGIEPSAALANVVPAIAAVSGPDLGTFRRIRETADRLVVTFSDLGLDYSRILFDDLGSLSGDSESEPALLPGVLERIDSLVRRTAVTSVDGASDLLVNLPAATRAAAGRPWVLEEALNLCTLVLAAGRNPGAILASTIGPLARVSREDIGHFRDLGNLVAARARDVPDDGWPAIAAAIDCSGSSAEDLGRAIDSVLHALEVPPWRNGTAGHDLLRMALIRAIIVAAPLAAGPGEFKALLVAVSREVYRFVDHHDRLEPWLMNGLSACVTLGEGCLERGIIAIHQLGEWCRRPGASAKQVLSSCAGPAAGIARGDVKRFLSVLESCEKVESALPEESMNTRQILALIMAMARAADTELPGQSCVALRLAHELLIDEAPGPGEDFLDLFRNIDRVLSLWPGAWTALLAHLLKAQGWYSRNYLDLLVRDASHLVTSVEDMVILRKATIDRGVAALDILSGVLIPLVRNGTVTGLAAEGETILAFLREVPFHNPDLYVPYRDAYVDPATTREERRRIVGKLQDEYQEILTAIRGGDVDTTISENSMFISALLYLFPTSMSVSNNSYQELYSAYSDRPNDVFLRIPPATDLRREYVLTRGGYHLRPGATVTEETWEPLLRSLSIDVAPGRQSDARLGWELLSLWSEGRIGRGAIKQRMWRRLVGILRRFGEAIPRDIASATDLLVIRRLFAERLRDAIEEVLIVARSRDPERYTRILQDKLSPAYRVGPGLTSAVQAQLEGYRNGLLSRDQAMERLSRLLGNFAVDVQTILNKYTEAVTETDLQELLESAGPRPVDPTTGTEVTRIHQELTGQEVQAMNRDLHGQGLSPGILEYRPASREVSITLEVTKRRAHCAVGFVEGVCVAADVSLWNNPDFLQVIIWDSGGICRGGMHLLFRDTPAGCEVILPGINPANALLQHVDAEQFLDVAIDFAGRIACAAGCRGASIPTDLSIASNRQQMREAIEARRWSRLSIPATRFGYSPFSYVIDEVYEVPFQS